MNHKDILSKLIRDYDNLIPKDAPAGLYELVWPVVERVLDACSYTIAYQQKQIDELRSEIKMLKDQANSRGKQ